MNGAEKCLHTNITETATLNTRAALIQETESFLAPRATAPSTNEIAFVSTCCTCTKNTALMNARFVENASLSHPVSTSICEYTVVRDPTNVPTASRPSPLLLFCVRIYVSIAGKSHSSASIVSARSPHTQHMTVTCDARTRKRSHACASTVERLLHSRTN